MKKILILLLILVTWSSCDKMPSNGDLDGQWQLMKIVNKSVSDFDSDIVIDKKTDRIYWRFQLDLLSIYTPNKKLNGHTHNSVARFSHTAQELQITKTYIHFENRDSLLTDPNTTILSPMGIDGNAETFVVDRLDDSQMVLSTRSKQLYFRKF